jgi:hypothetical protein
MIKIEKEPYYKKVFTKGLYDNNEFVIGEENGEENGEIYVTFFDYVYVDTAEHHAILEKIKKEYLKKNKKN